MKILKKMAIKAVTKKHTREVTSLVANEIRNNKPSFESIEHFDDYISKALSGLGSKIGIIDRIRSLDDKFDGLNGHEKMIRVVFEMVRFELMYDRSFGTESDFATFSKSFHKVISKWDMWESG